MRLTHCEASSSTTVASQTTMCDLATETKKISGLLRVFYGRALGLTLRVPAAA